MNFRATWYYGYVQYEWEYLFSLQAVNNTKEQLDKDADVSNHISFYTVMLKKKTSEKRYYVYFQIIHENERRVFLMQ